MSRNFKDGSVLLLDLLLGKGGELRNGDLEGVEEATELALGGSGGERDLAVLLLRYELFGVL